MGPSAHIVIRWDTSGPRHTRHDVLLESAGEGVERSVHAKRLAAQANEPVVLEYAKRVAKWRSHRWEYVSCGHKEADRPGAMHYRLTVGGHLGLEERDLVLTQVRITLQFHD